jgi:hypothetical protein
MQLLDGQMGYFQTVHMTSLHMTSVWLGEMIDFADTCAEQFLLMSMREQVTPSSMQRQGVRTSVLLYYIYQNFPGPKAQQLNFDHKCPPFSIILPTNLVKQTIWRTFGNFLMFSLRISEIVLSSVQFLRS